MITIRKPEINGKTDKEQLMQIRSYLFQFSEALQWTLENIKSGNGNNIATEKKVVESAAREFTEPENFVQLKSLIIKSADIVQAYYAEITKLIDESNRYVAQSDFGTFLQDTNNTLYADGSSFKQVITDLQQIYNTLDDKIAERLTNGYIKTGILEETADGMSVIGVEVGQTEVSTDAGEEVKIWRRFARFTADKLSFYDADGDEMAYVSQKKLHIRDASIEGSLELGAFMFDTSDGLALVPVDLDEEE